MHNTPVAATPKAFSLTSSALLLVASLTGIAGVLQTPALNPFLTDEIHARPDMVGFFFTGSAVIGILVSQFLAERSDRRGDRKNLIVSCYVPGMLACVLFAWNRSYFVLLFAGVFPSSSGLTVNPQMLALAREHADRTGREVVVLSSTLHAQISLTWVISPPLAYALVMGFSFTVIYPGAAVAFIIRGVVVRLFLLSMSRNVPLATDAAEAPRRNRRNTLLLFVICTLVWGINSLYIINMSLLIISELHLPEKLVGIMMGTAARLEVPTMLIAGYLAKRLGRRLLIRIAVAAGFFFYAGMLLAYSSTILLGLQLLNAICVGILGGISMLCFRSLMPGQTGSTTTPYMNTIRVGWIIAESLVGIVTEIWNCYAMFWFALVVIVVIVACLARIKDV